MYASLIGAGVSQLLDLFRSQTQKTTATADATPAPTATTPVAAPTTVGTGTAAGFSTDVNKLLLDLQSGTGSSTDPTSTVATDLKSVFGDLRRGSGAHGHHHSSGHPPAGAADGAGAANPFQTLASSLLAYTKAQGVSATSSAGLALSA